VKERDRRFLEQSRHFLHISPYVVLVMGLLGLSGLYSGNLLCAGLGLVAAMSWGGVLPLILKRRIQRLTNQTSQSDL
jgi:hypothetical protein